VLILMLGIFCEKFVEERGGEGHDLFREQITL
jgi:hypothetical protein